MDGASEPAFVDESLCVLCSKDPFDHVKKDGGGDIVDVLVRTLDKKEFKCRVSKDISVNDLKAAVARATGVQSQCQRLLSAGKEMSDECRLSDYSQAMKQVVYLVVRFPGASFGASVSEKDDELPSTVGEESALRSYAFRGTVTIPVPERSIERVMASLLQRGVVNGGQLQQLAALSANSWRSALSQDEPLRRTSGRAESSSHSHTRRSRRRDQRGAERERERESLRRRDPVLSRHRSPQTLEHEGMHEGLLEPRLYDDPRDNDYLLPPESASLDGAGEILSYAEGFEAVSSMPDLGGLVLQPAVEDERAYYEASAPAPAPAPLPAADWETHEDDGYSLPEGRMAGKRKHSRLSTGDFPQESVSSIVRRHRCAMLDTDPPAPPADPAAPPPPPAPEPPPAAATPAAQEGSAVRTDGAAVGEEGAARPGGWGAQVPIVMSLAAGPRQFMSVPDGLRDEEARKDEEARRDGSPAGDPAPPRHPPPVALAPAEPPALPAGRPAEEEAPGGAAAGEGGGAVRDGGSDAPAGQSVALPHLPTYPPTPLVWSAVPCCIRDPTPSSCLPSPAPIPALPSVCSWFIPVWQTHAASPTEEGKARSDARGSA
jgi:hypothetical protein